MIVIRKITDEETDKIYYGAFDTTTECWILPLEEDKEKLRNEIKKLGEKLEKKLEKRGMSSGQIEEGFKKQGIIIDGFGDDYTDPDECGEITLQEAHKTNLEASFPIELMNLPKDSLSFAEGVSKRKWRRFKTSKK